MKTAIGIFCIVLPVVLALWPDIKQAIKKYKPLNQKTA
jgi:hypothetical protein